jgi:hypothetical protein
MGESRPAGSVNELSFWADLCGPELRRPAASTSGAGVLIH